MYAFIETGGKQYKVTKGAMVRVDRIDAEPGAELTIDKVLAIVKDDATVLGTPYVAGASVKAKVAGEMRAAKVLVFKKLPRKSSRKIRGHRQIYTTIKITDILGG